MKKLFVILIALSFCFIALPQEKETQEIISLKEVKVSAPQFTGVQNILDVQKPDANQLKEYLRKNIIVPEQAQTCLHEGTEVISFVVTARGEVTDLKVVNSICREIDKEMIRVLEGTNGMWIPAVKDGKHVDMEKEVSLMFAFSTHNPAETFIKKASKYFEKAGENLIYKGNAKRAERLYNEAMAYLPYDKSLLLMRGLCRYELGNAEGAREDWKRLKSLGGLEMEDAYFADMIQGMKGYKELITLLSE
jgi:tetratricopeptide (TPR) repeat protein